MMLPGVSRIDRIPFSAKMIKLFLEIGFQEEFPEMTNKISSLLDDLLEKALEETEDTGKCCVKVPGGG